MPAKAIVSKAADGSKLQDLWYGYDAEQNPLFREDKRQGKTEWFTYDALDRLTCATFELAKPCARQWGYAPNGNLLSTPDVAKLGYDSPQHVHAVTSADGDVFASDAVGNQIERPGLSVHYTAFDQPKAFEAVGGRSPKGARRAPLSIPEATLARGSW